MSQILIKKNGWIKKHVSCSLLGLQKKTSTRKWPQFAIQITKNYRVFWVKIYAYILLCLQFKFIDISQHHVDNNNTFVYRYFLSLSGPGVYYPATITRTTTTWCRTHSWRSFHLLIYSIFLDVVCISVRFKTKSYLPFDWYQSTRDNSSHLIKNCIVRNSDQINDWLTTSIYYNENRTGFAYIEHVCKQLEMFLPRLPS